MSVMRDRLNCTWSSEPYLAEQLLDLKTYHLTQRHPPDPAASFHSF